MNSQLPMNEMPIERAEQNFSYAKPQLPEPELESMSEFERARLISKTWSTGQD